MKILRRILEKTAKARSAGDPDGCITHDYGDGWLEVDETHPAFPRSGVSTMQKAVNFATATAQHIAAGSPMASEEEIASRFAICQGCEHYDGKACSKCGCPVIREKAYFSKLSWADQSCPVGKWGPTTKEG